MTLPTTTRIVGALALTVLSACSDGAGPGSSGEMTLVLRRASTAPTLSETGKPGGTYTPSFAVGASSCPFQAAAVTIDEIYLQGEGGQTTLREDPITVELCELGDQALLLVQDVEIPGGSYQSIRFVIRGGYVQDAVDGSVYATEGFDVPAALAPPDAPLQTPSWGSSGLKVDFAGGPVTVDGGQKVIALDVNVAQSFGKPAGSSQWVMSPVITAGDISFSGSVRVRLELSQNVTLPVVEGTQVTLGDFNATAVHGTSTITQSFDPATGESVLFLSPHDTPYTITLGVPASLDVVSSPASHAVTIAEGDETAPVTFTVTSANLPVGSTNQAPSAVFSSPARPTFNATVGVPVNFNPAGTFDPEGAWVGTWDFGDGSSHTGTMGSSASHLVSHTYTAAGNYTVTWTVTDEEGATAVATTTASVTE
ncbi:MAG TPA: DUF4382 domain-containing protein [Gemmatimonadales bacterium]|nr:DUF4382 domain-containing protein [Gemmatimonadales bacterium]